MPVLSDSEPPGKCPEHETLSLFLLGQLEKVPLEAVGAHLEDCPICQRQIERLERESRPGMGNSRQQILQPAGVNPDEETDCERLRNKLISLRPSNLNGRTYQASADPVPLLESTLPKRIGQLELQECLGQGAMGIVFKAWHVKLKRPVAIKFLLPRHRDDLQFQQRFEREMEAIGQLSEHAHIVRANDAAEENGLPYLVMEYVEGCDLSTLLVRLGNLRVADACEMARQAALGLDHAHRHGVLHRDVKPSNLLLSTRGQVKVMDLGLAVFQEDPTLSAPWAQGPGMVGTADYMPPELWRGAPEIGAEADVYSLGCTLFKLLTGHAPFSDRDANDKKKAHLSAPVPSLRAERPAIPATLDALLQRMLAKKPRDRLQRLAEVALALEPFTEQADLRVLAESARSEHSDTHAVSWDRTRVTKILRSFKGRVSQQTPRTVFLSLLLVSLIAVAYMGWPILGTPAPTVLLAEEPEHLLWNYSPAEETIHVESQFVSLIKAGSTRRASGVLATRISPMLGQPDAGIFYAYHVEAVNADRVHRVDMLGLRPADTGSGYELYQGTGTYTQFADGHSAWIHDEQTKWLVTMVAGKPFVDLQLRFEDGKLQSVRCDERLLTMAAEPVDNTELAGKPIGVFGVFNQKGAASFWRTRFSIATGKNRQTSLFVRGNGPLALLNSTSRMLTEAETVEDFIDVRDLGEAVHTLARKLNAQKQVLFDAACMTIRAEHGPGKLLVKMPLAKGLPGN